MILAGEISRPRSAEKEAPDVKASEIVTGKFKD
jgi:hypothetical protein